jgi:arylsulfatase A-like enzyme
MLTKLLARSLAKKLCGSPHKRYKAGKQENKYAKKKVFGKWRYFLSWWFGEWCLYAWNHYEEEAEYQKFYKSDKIVAEYAKRLQDKYEQVEVTKVFDRRKKELGYLLTGKGKKAVVQQQPSNVVSFAEFKLSHQ